MNKSIITIVVVAVFFGAGGFFGGMQYQKNQTQGGFAGFTAGNSNGQRLDSVTSGRRGQGSGGGMINGDIIAKDDKSITVKSRDGGSKIVFYSGSTQISQMAAATADALAVGQSIMVQGTINADGSAVAQSIQLRPAKTQQNSMEGQTPASEGEQTEPATGQTKTQ
jgi:hypothetical protein